MESRAHQEALIKFGFKFGKNGAHSSRTMMLAELKMQFSATPVSASVAQRTILTVVPNLIQTTPPNGFFTVILRKQKNPYKSLLLVFLVINGLLNPIQTR
jgi:hypothetical protein